MLRLARGRDKNRSSLSFDDFPPPSIAANILCHFFSTFFTGFFSFRSIALHNLLKKYFLVISNNGRYSMQEKLPYRAIVSFAVHGLPMHWISRFWNSAIIKVFRFGMKCQWETNNCFWMSEKRNSVVEVRNTETFLRCKINLFFSGKIKKNISTMLNLIAL